MTKYGPRALVSQVYFYPPKRSLLPTFPGTLPSSLRNRILIVWGFREGAMPKRQHSRIGSPSSRRRFLAGTAMSGNCMAFCSTRGRPRIHKTEEAGK
jgi:hypothetical protein